MIERRPLTEALAYPVSAGIAAMAAAITVAKELNWNIDALAMKSTAFSSEPWRLVSSALPHGDFLHLLFNLLWLWIFGTIVEKAFGPLRTLALMALFAAGSAAAEYAIFSGGIGLSGVGYGLFGMLFVLNKRDRRFADAMDDRTAKLFVGWFFFCIALTVTDLMPIANVAHGVGALLGALIGLALAKPAHAVAGLETAKRPPVPLSYLGYLGFVVVLGLSLVGATLGRRYVNFSSDSDIEFALAAGKAFDENDFERAATELKRAIEIDPDDARNWYNLGVAYDRLERHDEASEHFQKAAELEPENNQYKRAASRR